MKNILTTYTFDKTAKTITSADFLDIEHIALITNITTGDIIYQFNNASKGGTLTATILTLVFDTSAMNNTDKLQIIMHSDITQKEDSPHTSGDQGIMMLAIRSDSDIATASDGDYTALKLDEVGRLKVSTQPASYTDGTGNITASAQTIFLNVERASNVTISMVATSLVGHNSTFEFSNNSTNGTDGTWYGIQVVRTNANTVETATGVLAVTPIYGWEASVNAYKWVRVRSTAHTSGTAAYIIKQGTYATEPIPAIQVTATQPVSGTVTATVAAASLAIPGVIADVASAALTTTTTTGTLTPTFGNAYTVSIPVTAVTGTTPVLDVMVQESNNSGTNWEDVYQFPIITATGFYVSPMLKLNGNRVRYVQTVGGTTPSFTRAINRLQASQTTPMIRQKVDRTLVPTTLNSVTGSIITRGCEKLGIIVNAAAMTTPPVLTFEGSIDGTNWFNLSDTNATYTPTASTVNEYMIGGTTPFLAQFARVRVSTAGVTATINDITLICKE